MEKNIFRWVICVDIEAENLTDSYKLLYENMSKISSEEFEWESSDEVYCEEGNRVSEKDIVEIRLDFLRKNEINYD